MLTWGRRQRSPALVGDGWHLLTDVATSVGVIIGLLLAMLTGWQLLDPALAALVAANILWAGWRLVRESVSGLMDEPGWRGRSVMLIWPSVGSLKSCEPTMTNISPVVGRMATKAPLLT